MCKKCGKTDLFSVKSENGKLIIREIPEDESSTCIDCLNREQ